jgi:hemoglobin
MPSSNGIKGGTNSNGATSSSNVHAGTTTSVGVLNSGASARKETLLAKLGGREMLRKSVDLFYDRLVKDPTLDPFFRNTNIQLLKWHQFNFMSVAFASVPEDLDVANLILSKHRWLFDMGLDETHYDIMMNHFVLTLRDLDIKQDLVEEALFMLSPVRAVFVQGSALAASRKESGRRMHNLQVTAMVAVVGIGMMRLYRNMTRNTRV